ncbi:MAG: cellulase family glycosylhydrolase, partial [Patescibacteria group bacterium]
MSNPETPKQRFWEKINSGVVIILIVGLLSGIVLLQKTRFFGLLAIINSAVKEVESTNISSGATVSNDNTASGGQYVELIPLAVSPTPTRVPTAVPTAGPTTTPAPTITPGPSPTHAPIPPGFVGRSGSKLVQGGQTFRFSGANVSWLAMRVGDNGWTTPAEIDNVLLTVTEMGGRVVRSHTMGISVGCGRCVKPSKTTINNDAFKSIDYAIKRAGELGIYLIIPFSDEAGGGGYYSGGNRVFSSWEGGANFYTSPTVKATFKEYISLMVNHVNQYTNVPNRINPTILAWETGNEMRTAPCEWTREISAYIKSIDPNHLVLDGNDFFKDSPVNCSDLNYLDIATVDIFQTHHYGGNYGNISPHVGLAASHNKAFIEGEHGLVDSSSIAAIQGLYSLAETNTNFAGTLFWQLFGHADHHGYLQTSDALLGLSPP